MVEAKGDAAAVEVAPTKPWWGWCGDSGHVHLGNCRGCWVCWVGRGGDVCLGGGGSRFGEGKALLLLRDGGCREGEGNLFSVN